MKKLKSAIIGLVLLIISLFAVGCTSSPAPAIPLKAVTVEDLVAKPNPALLDTLPAKKKLVVGATNTEALGVMTSNNIRTIGVENKYRDLQQYVCSLFKDPVGPVCKTK
jgi:hypothetical protein